MLKAKRRQFVLAMIGPVGSGKTYIAKKLARRLVAVHVNTDAIRVALQKQHKPQSRAIAISHRQQEKLLKAGESLILDYDAVNPVRRRELSKRVRKFGAKLYFIQVKTPERIILARLRKKRYTATDLFKNAEEAIRVYFIRKKFHAKPSRFTPSFTVDTTKLMRPQIEKIMKGIKGP